MDLPKIKLEFNSVLSTDVIALSKSYQTIIM